jgi:peptidoglycan biosynthesis protein MviN/MurJ (putative lipid II flippase)
LVIGALLGATYFTNIFQAGYVLPSNVFTVIAGPVLGMVVVPTVVHAVSVESVERAASVLGHIAGRLLAVAGLCAVALALLSPLLAWTLVFDVPAAERNQAWLLTTVLILFVAPQVVLYTVAELGVAAQQGRQRFALAAAAPAVESLGVIATLLVTTWIFGMGPDVERAPLAMMIMLGCGTTCSVALHAGLQVYGAARVGMFAWPSRGWRADPPAQESLRRIVRSIPVAAGPALTNYGLTVVAATVPGGVLVVQLSYQAFYALSFVGARAVSMAALPGLAEAAASTDQRRFGSSWRQGLFFAVVAGLPPLCLLAAFAGPTADLLAIGELRQPTLIQELTNCLAVVAFAQFAGGIHDYSRKTLFSRLDDRGPRIASWIGLATSAAVTVSTLLLPINGGRLTGLIVAILAGEIAAAATAIARLQLMIRPEALTDVTHAVTAGTATLTMAPVIAAGWWLIAAIKPSRILELPILLGCGVAALAVFLLVLRHRQVRWRTAASPRAA